MKAPKIRLGFKGLIVNTLYIFAGGILVWSIFKVFNFSTPTEGDEAYQLHIKKEYAVYAPILPEKLDFAGENVPLENFDVREALDKELLKTMYWHSEIFLYIKRANRYFPEIEKILKKHNIPDDFKYLALAESGLDNVTSPANAVGYWQFLKATGKEFGLEITDEVDERYHYIKSTEAACLYLKKMYAKYKSWSLVAASYNMGTGALDESMTWQNATSYYDMLLNTETSRYLYRILAYKLILTKPEDYGFRYRSKDLYPPFKTKKIEIDSSVTDFVKFAKQLSVNYKLFKILNPQFRKTSFKNTTGKKYEIMLPDENMRSKLYNAE